MDNSIWVKMHGGTTHFPIALVMASVVFDLAGVIVPDSADGLRRAGFRAAGYYTLLLAALIIQYTVREVLLFSAYRWMDL